MKNVLPELSREIPAKDMPTKITMFSGKHLAPLALQPEDIVIEDVAHHLAMQVRWSGAVRWHYSVAQHCWLASCLVPEEDAYDALMHDAAETYLQDMAKPLKNNPDLGRGYRKAEKIVEAVLGPHFGVRYSPKPPSVVDIDLRLLITEAIQLVHGRDHWGYYEDVQPLPTEIRRWTPEKAERRFLARYEELKP